MPAPTSERQLGQRCCLPLPPETLDGNAAEALTADLEILAHPIRLRLLSVLANAPDPACVCDLEAVVPVKQPTVSHHLKLLRSAGLVRSERRGHWTYYSVKPEALQGLRRRIAAGLDHLGTGEIPTDRPTSTTHSTTDTHP